MIAILTACRVWMKNGMQSVSTSTCQSCQGARGPRGVFQNQWAIHDSDVHASAHATGIQQLQVCTLVLTQPKCIPVIIE